MSVQLREPKRTVELDRARVAAYVYEDNPFLGQRWVIWYVVIGRLTTPDDESTFEQHTNPDTGEQHFLEVKIENGMHPLRSGMALGKCDACGVWYQRIGGACDVEGCTGTVRAYDGFTRLMRLPVPPGFRHHQVVQKAAYHFMMTERIPDPESWDEMTILDAIGEGVE